MIRFVIIIINIIRVSGNVCLSLLLAYILLIF